MSTPTLEQLLRLTATDLDRLRLDYLARVRDSEDRAQVMLALFLAEREELTISELRALADRISLEVEVERGWKVYTLNKPVRLEEPLLALLDLAQETDAKLECLRGLAEELTREESMQFVVGELEDMNDRRQHSLVAIARELRPMASEQPAPLAWSGAWAGAHAPQTAAFV